MANSRHVIKSSATEPILPVITFAGHGIFPNTFFLLKHNPKSSKGKLINRILKNTPPECLVAVQNFNLDEDNPDCIAKIGVVASLYSQEDRVKFSAQYRAQLSNIEYNPHEHTWSARATKLDDEPEEEELVHDHNDLPMILGCVESIYRLLLDLKQITKDNELLKKIDSHLQKLKLDRREPKIAFYLPWHILIDFSHVDEQTKEKMLATNSVMERLQTIVDILKNEKRILSYAEILSEDDPRGLEKNGGK